MQLSLNSRSYRSTKEGKKSLEFMGSSTCVEIGHIFSGGRNVLPWTCHGVEWVGGRSLRRRLGLALGMPVGTWAKHFKIKCVHLSCTGRAVPLGNGQLFECRRLVSKLTYVVPEKEEPSKCGAEERECSWRRAVWRCRGCEQYDEYASHCSGGVFGMSLQMSAPCFKVGNFF